MRSIFCTLALILIGFLFLSISTTVPSISGVVAAAHPDEHDETSDTLAETASKLAMFVDKLPRMRVVRGYVRAPNATTGFSPAHLTIGMYLKKWVKPPTRPHLIPAPTVESNRIESNRT
jgi:hypothetical protein